MVYFKDMPSMICSNTLQCKQYTDYQRIVHAQEEVQKLLSCKLKTQMETKAFADISPKWGDVLCAGWITLLRLRMESMRLLSS